MKIIHLCNYFQHQIGYQEYFLAKEHTKLGHNVTVVTSDRYFPFPDYDKTVKSILGNRIVGKKEEIIDNFKVIRLKTLFEISSRVWLLGLNKVIKEIKPDLVICHGISNFNSLRIINIKKRIKFKLYYDDHMLFDTENKTFLGKLFYLFFDFNKIKKNGDRFIAISDQSFQFINTKYKIEKEKIELIPLGADIETFKKDENARIEFRKKYNIEDEQIIICYTGKIIERKGAHNIILAIEKIYDKIIPKIVILFVGNFDQEYENKFQKYLEILNKLNIKFIHIPFMENKELVKIYSAIDIACWPREATISTIEASSCSVPIIVPDFLEDRIKNNNGLSIKRDDIKDLGEKLLLLINDKNLRINMGKKGREFIEKELSWNIIAKKFL